MDQLRSMSVFVAVVERGSFAAAAEHLRLSRTAASKHVMELEAQLGATLLNRTTRSVSLTTAGTAYFERAKRILEEVEEANSEAAMQTRTPHGRLRVSAPMSFGISHLSPRLKGYMDAYPEVAVDLVLNDRQVDLIEEGFDLTIRIGQLTDSGLIARKVATSRMMLCASEDYLKDHGCPTHPADLTGRTCLGYAYWSGQGAWAFREPGGEAISIPIRDRLWSNNGDALLNAAISGLGIVLQPDFIAYDAVRRGDLVEILKAYTDTEIGIHVLYAKTSFMPLRVRTFIDYLIDSFAADTPWRATDLGRPAQ